ncbi:MAG TPA: MFS transporter [Chloroflexota bacterium]
MACRTLLLGTSMSSAILPGEAEESGSRSEALPTVAVLSVAATATAAREGHILAAILCAPLVSFLNTIGLVPFLSVIAEELDTSVSALGQVTAVSMVVATGLGLVAGQFADRYGYRRMLMVGLGTVILSAFASAFAFSFVALLIAGLIGAVSRAVVAPISLTIAGTWFEGTARQRTMGLVSAAIAGAAVIGVPLMASVAALWSWRLAFAALGVTAAAAIVLTRRALPADRSKSTSRLGVREILGAYRPLLGDRPTLSILGSNLFRTTGAWAVGTYIATFLVRDRDLSVQQASLAFAVAGLGLFSGSLAAGGPLRIMAPRELLVGCSAIGTSLVGVSMALPVPTLWVFGLVFAGLFLNGLGNVAANLLLVDETPAGPATTMSLNGAALSLASAMGGVVGGLLLALGGYTAIGWSGPVLGVLAALLAWNSRR